MKPYSLSRILYCIISVGIGFLFVFGAYAKLQNIEPFEWSLAETGYFSFAFANVFSRIFIAAEFFIGLLFIGIISIRGWVFTIGACLLLLFNIYLLWVLFTFGNNGNCGCFGDALKMLPMQAMLKNLGMILAIYILSKQQHLFANSFSKIQIFIIALMSLGYTVIKEAPDFIFINENQTIYKHKIDLSVLYSKEASTKPLFNYREGKHIISILSTGCVFCKKAARKIHTIYSRNNLLPMYNVILGDSTQTIKFMKETLAGNVPYQINENTPYLYKLANNRLPCILWIENGSVIKISNYFNLKENDIESWIKK
jgi:hypothetical protein